MGRLTLNLAQRKDAELPTPPLSGRPRRSATETNFTTTTPRKLEVRTSIRDPPISSPRFRMTYLFQPPISPASFDLFINDTESLNKKDDEAGQPTHDDAISCDYDDERDSILESPQIWTFPISDELRETEEPQIDAIQDSVLYSNGFRDPVDAELQAAGLCRIRSTSVGKPQIPAAGSPIKESGHRKEPNKEQAAQLRDVAEPTIDAMPDSAYYSNSFKESVNADLQAAGLSRIRSTSVTKPRFAETGPPIKSFIQSEIGPAIKPFSLRTTASKEQVSLPGRDFSERDSHSSSVSAIDNSWAGMLFSSGVTAPLVAKPVLPGITSPEKFINQEIDRCLPSRLRDLLLKAISSALALGILSDSINTSREPSSTIESRKFYAISEIASMRRDVERAISFLIWRSGWQVKIATTWSDRMHLMQVKYQLYSEKPGLQLKPRTNKQSLYRFFL